jgi:hypothetical protein
LLSSSSTPRPTNMIEPKENNPSVQISNHLDVRELQTTLSKIYPLEIPLSFATKDSALNSHLCWKFFRPSSEAVEKLIQATNSYEGTVRWMLVGGSAGQICFAAQPIERIGSSQPLTAARRLVNSDLSDFSHYIETALDLREENLKTFQYDFRVPPVGDYRFLGPWHTSNLGRTKSEFLRQTGAN